MKPTPALMQLSFLFILLFSSIAAAPFSNSSSVQPGIENILQLPAGEPCPYDSIFTCVTIEVPLDHFNPADTRTIPVVFAILPASGDRKGMFVTATGGPGTSGVLSADYYSSGFDPSIFEAFDIVFFDQRGMGLSGGLTCPLAATDVLSAGCKGSDARSGSRAQTGGKHLQYRLRERVKQPGASALSRHETGSGRP